MHPLGGIARAERRLHARTKDRAFAQRAAEAKGTGWASADAW
jgi:hypothetical protein